MVSERNENTHLAEKFPNNSAMEHHSSKPVLPGASFLKRTLKRLSSTQCLKIGAEEAAPVAVVALQRYLSENEAEQLNSYDVTVTDGAWRARCLLHPGLNDLVHSNSLGTGADVIITQCSYVYNERMLGHGYIRIEQLRCVPGPSAVLPQVEDVGSLPVLVKAGMERSGMLQSDAPLLLSRKHYLPLWNNDDPEGDMWRPAGPSPNPVLDGEIPQPPLILMVLVQKPPHRHLQKPPMLPLLASRSGIIAVAQILKISFSMFFFLSSQQCPRLSYLAAWSHRSCPTGTVLLF